MAGGERVHLYLTQVLNLLLQRILQEGGVGAGGL